MSTFEWRANDDKDEVSKRLDNGGGALFVCQLFASNGFSQPALTLMPRVKSKPSDPSIPSAMIVKPGPGDDLSPPNAVQANNMNGIAIPVSASAGWSKSPPVQEGIYPSAIAYDLQLKTNTNAANNNSNNDNSLEMTVSLEYSNPHASHGETMMVKVAIAKTLIQAETGTEMALVATQFQEYLDEKKEWIDITADVEYTQTANAVVDAVLADPNAGQTAGKATVTAETIELTLGPFSAKARLNLTFQAEQLYTYDAMSTQVDGSDIGTHRLLPLWVTLPFAPTDNEGGLSDLSVRFQAPSGASVLSMDTNSEAYWDLKQQDVMKSSTILAVPELVPQAPSSTTAPTSCGGGTVGYQFQWESLPPRSCGILAWLALPNPVDDNDDCGFDFVHIGRTLEEMSDSMVQEPTTLTSTNIIKTQAQAVLQVPSAEDMASLQVPMPGHGPMGSLWRLNIKMPEAQSRQTPYLILNLAMSDKSGSTGRMVGGSGGASATTMRQRFNELAETRFLKRLESIPQLVQAGVLLMDDVWMDVFLAFDNAAPRMSIHRVTFCVKDVFNSIVEVVQSIRAVVSGSAACSSSNKLPTILQHVKALRAVKPSGLTDFSVAPSTLVSEFAQWYQEAESFAAPKKLQTCSFVEFDTDGGHNRQGDYLESLKRLCDVYDVRNGVVTGFGSWLNQDCASKVARTIGSIPAQLSLEMPQPGTEGMDKVFRRGFSAWVSALRQPPSLTIKISAGSVSIPSSRPRNANAIEVLALQSAGDGRLPKFMAPDVTNESYTKTKIEGAPAGGKLVIYLVSRLDFASQLATALDIETSAEGGTASVKANVRADREVSTGNFLAFHWLRMLTGRSGEKGFQMAPLVTMLGTRLEDEVSFRFNIASPSGRTSYLGRCKTLANRASIDAAHQPAPPGSPLKVLPPKPSSDIFRIISRGQISRGCQGGQGGLHTTKNKTVDKGVPMRRCAEAVPDSASFAPIMTSVPSLQSSALHIHRGQGVTRSVGSSAMPFHFSTQGVRPQQKQQQQQQAGRRRASLSAATPASKRAHTTAKPKISKLSWINALETPIGSSKPSSSKQDYKDLQRALAVVGHAAERLRGKVIINYVCDVCNRPIGSGENRYHCFDCKDFDGCTRCKDDHKLPFHRMDWVSPNGLPPNQAETSGAVGTDDPLVDMLLEPSKVALPVAVATLERCLPKIDRTRVWCEDQVRRFLLTILHWWPLYRGQCVFRDKLPLAVSEEMVERILHCCCGANVHASHSSENLEAMLSTLSVIMDSLLRLDPSLQLVTNEAFGF